MLITVNLSTASDRELKEVALRLAQLLKLQEMPGYQRTLDQIEETLIERMTANNPYKDVSKG